MLFYMAMRYTLQDLLGDFPNEEACMEWLINYVYPEGIACTRCQKITKHYRDKDRKSYSCGICGHHVHPMANTVLRNTRTPLTYWFYVIYIMTNTKSGISAKQIERELGVTYKTAWRMMHQVRKMMSSTDAQLSGEVEIDETFVHANVYKRSSAQRKYGRTGQRAGEVLFGAVERGGSVKIFHVKSAGERILTPLIKQHISQGTIIHSDGYRAYMKLPLWGYGHKTTNHSLLQFYTEDSYTQNIENVWSHLKRGLKGVYRHVEPKYLQAYANEYAWRYSHRNDVSMFWSLMGKIAHD